MNQSIVTTKNKRKTATLPHSDTNVEEWQLNEKIYCLPLWKSIACLLSGYTCNCICEGKQTVIYM